MKTVGIIGGLGPETTAKFYERLIEYSYKTNKESRPPMLIWNVPMNYALEEKFIKTGKDREEYLPYLIQGAKKLEAGGADFIVIPCNSVHIHIEKIRQSVNIPVLSIIEETISFLKEKGISNIGLLATKPTTESNLYQEPLNKQRINVLSLSGNELNKLGKIITNLVLNNHTTKDRKDLITLIKSFSERNVNTILLACTDLQLITPSIKGMEIYDTMEILVTATVRTLL